ncbi:glutamine-rich protein 2 [Onychomys torridus]|uniref:glutamine-rich protein 2 n=1 Tax=Onychomys torridus TaxID=38674 RepID=UPI00167F7AA6|nr:glutamine-rich protein 2 [Onychomys torridus]
MPPPSPSLAANRVSLRELADLAIGTPEVGAVNFTALHTLIVAMLKSLNLQGVLIDFHYPSAESGRSLDVVRSSLSTPHVSSSKERRRSLSRQSLPSQTLESQVKDLGTQVLDLSKQIKNMDNKVHGIATHMEHISGVSDLYPEFQRLEEEMTLVAPQASPQASPHISSQISPQISPTKSTRLYESIEMQEKSEPTAGMPPQVIQSRPSKTQKEISPPKPMNVLQDLVEDVKALKEAHQKVQEFPELNAQVLLQRVNELEKVVKDRQEYLSSDSSTATFGRRSKMTSLTSTEFPSGVFPKASTADQARGSTGGPEQILTSGVEHPTERIISGDESISSAGFRDLHPGAREPSQITTETDRQRTVDYVASTRQRKDEQQPGPTQQDLLPARDQYGGVPISQGPVYPTPDVHGIGPFVMDQPAILYPGPYPPALVPFTMGQLGVLPPEMDDQGLVPFGMGQSGVLPPDRGQQGLERLRTAQLATVPFSTYQQVMMLPRTDQHGMEQAVMYDSGLGPWDMDRQGLIPVGIDQHGFVILGTSQQGLIPPGVDQQGLVMPGIDQHAFPPSLPDQYGLVSPGLTQASTDQQGFGQPSSEAPGFMQPGVDQRGTVQPGVDQRGTVQPGVDQRGTVQPGVDQRGTVQPGVDQRGTVQPGVDQRGTVQPGVDQRGTVQPGVDQRGTVQPGVDQRGTVQPGVDQRGTVQPGIDQHGTVQPGVDPRVLMRPEPDRRSSEPARTDRPSLVQSVADRRSSAPLPADRRSLGQPGASWRGSAGRQSLVQPGADQRGLVQPGTDQTGAVQPGLVQPGAVQPGLVQPGAVQPGLVQPGAVQPGLVQPGAVQPGLVQPGAVQPGLVQPGAVQPGPVQPGAIQPGMMHPGVIQPGMMQPGVIQPGMMQPLGAVQHGLVQPDVYAPGLMQLGAIQDSLVQPEIHQRGFVQPGADQLDMAQPGAVQPGPVQPGAVQPGPVQPGAVQPGPVQPGAVQPGPVQPGAVQPGPVQPGAVQPGPVQPGAVQPGLVQLGAVQPGPVQPGAIQPGMMQPGVDQHGLVQPGAFPTDQPGLLQPGADQPGLLQPGADQPGLLQPGADQPGLLQPGADQPGLLQPGADQPYLLQPRTDWFSMMQLGRVPGAVLQGLVQPDSYQRQILTSEQVQGQAGQDILPVLDHQDSDQQVPGEGPTIPGAVQYDQTQAAPSYSGPEPRAYTSGHILWDPSRKPTSVQFELATPGGSHQATTDSRIRDLSYLHRFSSTSETRSDGQESLEKLAPSFPMAVETFRLMGEIIGLYVELKDRMKDLDEEHAGQTDLEKIQYLLAMMVKKTIPQDLQDQLKSLKALNREVRQDKAKLEKIQKLLDTEGSATKDVKPSHLSLQLGILRVTVSDIEKELSELRESQERGKAAMENSVSEASLYLQDQLDKLRTIIESMLSSSSTLLSMSITPHKSTSTLVPGQIDPEATCPACSLDVSHQVSLLVQRYEQLQDMVSGLAASRPSKKAKLQSQDEELLGHVQSAILQVQGDCEKLNVTTSNLIEDHRQKQKDIEVLYQGIERLDKEKADRDHLEMEIDVKADKSALASKVSRIQFDATTEQLNHMMQELVAKMSGQEQDWQKLVDKLLAEMDSKLDRLELDPVKQMLEDRWKSLRQQLKERSPLYQADEAAAMRRQLLAHFHCLSCDRPLETAVTGQVISMTPIVPSMPGHRSVRPYTVFELEQVRQQSRNLKLGSSFARGDLSQMERSVGRLRSMHSKMLMDIEKVQIHFGGSVKASSQMIRELLHAQCLSHPCYKRGVDTADYTYSTVPRRCGGSHTLTYPYRRNRPQHLSPLEEIQIAMKHDEVDILGLDGHIYKGRMDTRLPGILGKDAPGMAKHKSKQLQQLQQLQQYQQLQQFQQLQQAQHARPHMHRQPSLDNSGLPPSRPQSAQTAGSNSGSFLVAA